MYKKQKFNDEELAMLFQAFSKNLFTRPRKSDVFSICYPLDGCLFFFKPEYYNQLINDFEKSYTDGKFTVSNSNDQWVNLMNKLKVSETIDALEEGNIEDYYETTGKYWN